MKYYFTSLLFLLLTFTVVSCKKDKLSPPSPAPLIGNWELRYTGSIMGPASNYPAGNGRLLKFSDGYKYEFVKDGQVEESGNFHLSREIAKYNNERVDLIRLGDQSFRDSYVITNDTLKLSTYPYDEKGELIMDGGGSTYVRVK